MMKAIVQRLIWRDPEFGALELPSGTMTLRYGFGSGLASRPGDTSGSFWAIGDRGPNIKVQDAVRLYGLDQLSALGDLAGAKIMPRLEVGPAIAELRVVGEAIQLLRIIPLKHRDGRPVTGLPHPGSDQLLSEPVFNISGRAIPPDDGGLDTEGIVALANGGFWVGDEFGPSLVRLDAAGIVRERLLPAPAGAPRAARCLPAIAARRQLNRGFEALATSGDERYLFAAFQSPLAHPDEEAHRLARHVRIWKMDVRNGEVVAQYAYPLDPPASFALDSAAGAFDTSDIKVSELLWLPANSLLVLERGSATTKLYLCRLEAPALGDEHLDLTTRPTLEELSARELAPAFPVLTKSLLFSTDDHPEVARDLEGMVALSPSELLLVSDNDFGVLGAETSFWRVQFSRPIGEHLNGG